MGCLGIIAAIILFSAGIDRLDKNPVLASILLGASILVGVVTWILDRLVGDE